MDRSQEILAALEALNAKLTKALEINKPEKYCSDEVNELYGALAKAQGEFRMAQKDSNNPFFKTKYADLAEIVNASRAALSKNGLSVTQPILTTADGAAILKTILGHSSGQWISSTMKILPAKNEAQALGGYITYIKRYAYGAIVGVVTGDEDDDGETAMKPIRERFIEKPSAYVYEAQKQSFQTLNVDQLAEVENALASHPDIAADLLKHLEISALSDIPASRYRWTMDNILKIKNARLNAAQKQAQAKE